MGRLTRNTLPAPLRPEDLRVAQACTVVDTFIDVPAQTRSGKTTYMTLAEFQGKGFYLNDSDKDTLIEVFGTDDTDAFKGKKIAVQIRRVPNFKSDPKSRDYDPREPREIDVVRVAPAESWDEFPGAEVPVRKRAASSKRNK
jgi:hypothetical protein